MHYTDGKKSTSMTKNNNHIMLTGSIIQRTVIIPFVTVKHLQ